MTSDEPIAASEPALYVGQFLFGPTVEGGPDHLWCVKNVRYLKTRTKATLLSSTEKMTMEATATFPDGVVRAPFRVVNGDALVAELKRIRAET